MDGVYVYFRHNAAQTVMVDAEQQRRGTHRRHATLPGGHRQGATTGTDVVSGQAHALAEGIAVPARSATILETEVSPCRCVRMSSLLLTLLATQTTAAVSDGRACSSSRHRPRRHGHGAASRVDAIDPRGRRATSTSGCRRATARTRRSAIRSCTCTTGRTCSIPRRRYGNVDWAVDEVMTGSDRRAARCARRSSSASGTRTKRREEYMPQRAVTGDMHHQRARRQ